MKSKKINYLFYVRYALSGLTVYRCKTNDPSHVTGEKVYRSLEYIDYLTFGKETKSITDYWKENDIEIKEFVLKYDERSISDD